MELHGYGMRDWCEKNYETSDNIKISNRYVEPIKKIYISIGTIPRV